VHQSFYDALIRSSSYGFLLDVSEVAPPSMYCGRDSFFAFDRSGGAELHVPIIEHEVCRFCWHDVPVEGRCDNCGARPGDRR
jgi:hypothetical protein